MTAADKLKSQRLYGEGPGIAFKLNDFGVDLALWFEGHDYPMHWVTDMNQAHATKWGRAAFRYRSTDSGIVVFHTPEDDALIVEFMLTWMDG